METYFITDYAQINYHAESNAIIFIWLVPGSYNEFRESMEKIMEAEQHFKTGKLIVDTNHQGVIHPDNQKWLATDWWERASKIGHSHVAIIMPKDIFAALSVEETMAQVNGVIVGYFDNMEDAIEWMKRT
ncbi:MAG TPA: hypothetical protein VIM65_21425 [Cyclobacteriaceae bacterium]